jgi:hypothetical protein
MQQHRHKAATYVNLTSRFKDTLMPQQTAVHVPNGTRIPNQTIPSIGISIEQPVSQSLATATPSSPKSIFFCRIQPRRFVQASSPIRSPTMHLKSWGAAKHYGQRKPIDEARNATAPS